MPLRILLLGKDGQVGASLLPRLATLGPVDAHGRDSCDLSNTAQLRDVIRSARPNLVVNAAAYTAVDKAETDKGLCYRINAEAPGVIAEEAARSGAWLIHYSTDYVFDGSKATAYHEDDTPSPLNVYGHAKLAGDRAVATATDDHTILRVSWVYGATGRNFPKTILKLASERDELKIVADQFGAPTSSDFIADISTSVAARLTNADRQQLRGIFNVAPTGRVSWHGYAVELIRAAAQRGWPLSLSEDRIFPIPASDYPTPAARPMNSSLDTARIRALLGIGFPAWQTALPQFFAQLTPPTKQV